MTSKEKSELQKEVIDSLAPNPHGRLILAPRMGKTKMIIDIIKRDKPKSILWVTPSAKLAEEDIPKEFETWKAKKYLKNLNTVTWMSLNKIEKYYDTIVLDEEQFATENNLETLFNGTLTYGNIISMTGTATRHDEKIELYKKLNLDVLYKISINTAVDIGLLSNYRIKVLEVSMSDKRELEAGNKTKKWMISENAQYLYLDGEAKRAMYQKRKDATFRIMERMRFVKNSPSKKEVGKWLYDNLTGRKLMFCSTIEQAEAISKHTYHSKTDNTDLKAFQEGEIDTIAMVNSGGTGFTYKEIDHLIVVQADSDKNGLTSQKICRTLLQQKDYNATIWIVSLINTQDEKWVESTLQNFDKTKIEYVRFKNLQNEVQ